MPDPNKGWRRAMERKSQKMRADMDRNLREVLFPDLASASFPEFPEKHGLAAELEDGMTRDELQKRVDGLIVPMEAREWARRYEDAVAELEELARRSPFPQLDFAALSLPDSITTRLIDNASLDE